MLILTRDIGSDYIICTRAIAETTMIDVPTHHDIATHPLWIIPRLAMGKIWRVERKNTTSCL